MGGACCVAARDKSIVNPSGTELVHRNIRYSPTWSFRWDSRGRVAGEETSISWVSDGICRSDGSVNKYESAYASSDGSPLETSQARMRQKSSLSEGSAMHARTAASDQSISRNASMDTNLEQVKESAESSVVSNTSPTKLSQSLPSTSSLSTSPISSLSHTHPASSIMPRWPRHSPGNQQMEQVSNPQTPGQKSSGLLVTEDRPNIPSWSNESTRGSHGGSSDSWSMHAFSELMASSHKERWSSDNESLGFNCEKTSSTGRKSASPSADLQTCGICSKLLTEKSLWSSQKLIVSNELSVVAVLICGHVYHAECLETMTPEIDKYDPACPICTLGEKQTHKLSQKAYKAELDAKARNKRSRNRIVDSELDDVSIMFDHVKGDGHQGKGPKMASSSSMKSSSAKPFLRRHFSFGSKGNRSSIENHTPRKKGIFWTRSMKG